MQDLFVLCPDFLALKNKDFVVVCWGLFAVVLCCFSFWIFVAVFNIQIKFKMYNLFFY